MAPNAPTSPIDALRAQQENHAKAAAENAAKAQDTAKVDEEVTFFSRIAGSKFYFTNGDIAHFVSGEYVTNREYEIKELNAVCEHRGNHMFSKTKVPIQNQSDAIILQEVGKGGGTGMVGSSALAAQLLASARAGG